MLIVILIISILNLLIVCAILTETNRRITNLEITLDEVKKQTDKLGTYNFK